MQAMPALCTPRPFHDQLGLRDLREPLPYSASRPESVSSRQEQITTHNWLILLYGWSVVIPHQGIVAWHDSILKSPLLSAEDQGAGSALIAQANAFHHSQLL